MKPADCPHALRVRAAIVDALGDAESARLLRGYASAIEQSASALPRIRTQIAETVSRYLGPLEHTPIAQTWRDALGDVVGAGTQPKVRDRSAEVNRLKNELALVRHTLAECQLKLGRLAPVTRARSLEERLRAEEVPDGRSWFDVAAWIGRKAGVRVEELLKRTKKTIVGRVRWHVWWWLYYESGATYTSTYIAEVWAYDHTSVIHGIQRHEEARVRDLEQASTPLARVDAPLDLAG